LATIATSFSILTVPVTVSPALYELLSRVTVSEHGGASRISGTVVSISGTPRGGAITSCRVMVGASGSGAGAGVDDGTNRAKGSAAAILTSAVRNGERSERQIREMGQVSVPLSSPGKSKTKAKEREDLNACRSSSQCYMYGTSPHPTSAAEFSSGSPSSSATTGSTATTGGVGGVPDRLPPPPFLARL